MLNFFRETHTCESEHAYCKVNGEKPCKSVTTNPRFGIIDDISQPEQPAYLQEYREEDWNVTVEKNSGAGYAVTFKAIDKCLEFPPPPDPGIKNNICEGMLYFGRHIIFVEIKERTHHSYNKRSREQLIRTIQVFCQCHNINEFDIREAYISNNLKPQAPEITPVEKEKFADRNFGFQLYRKALIKLP